MELLALVYPKENIMDLLTKSLLIELVHNSLKRIDLQPLKMKKVDNYTPIQLIEDSKIQV